MILGMRRLMWITLCAVSPMIRAFAQSAPVVLVGVAYDSLHSRPLVNAFVAINGSDHSTTTDDRGIFRFDSVPSGSHTVTVLHRALDSLGLSGISKTVIVAAGLDTVRLSVPSFPTLWRTVCPGLPPPADSGFVFGIVRDATTERPAAHANISMSWPDIAVTASHDVVPKTWVGETRTDSTGSYAVCGVPRDAIVRLIASSDSLATDLIEFNPAGRGVIRRDLLLGPPPTVSPRTAGIIAGRVHDANGKPASGVAIQSAGSVETRTDADGRFILHHVPLGTREIEARSVGMLPASTTVDVTARDTAFVEFTLDRVMTLAPIVSHASSSARHFLDGITERRQAAWGRFVDSTDVSRQPSIDVVIAMTIGAKRPYCAAFIDGRLTAPGELRFHSPLDVAVIEFQKDVGIPIEYRIRDYDCWYVFIWTKDALP